MRASFVIGLGICVVAGFNSQVLRTEEPYKEDGVAMGGEPDPEKWEDYLVLKMGRTTRA